MNERVGVDLSFSFLSHLVELEELGDFLDGNSGGQISLVGVHCIEVGGWVDEQVDG